LASNSMIQPIKASQLSEQTLDNPPRASAPRFSPCIHFYSSHAYHGGISLGSSSGAKHESDRLFACRRKHATKYKQSLTMPVADFFNCFRVSNNVIAIGGSDIWTRQGSSCFRRHVLCSLLWLRSTSNSVDYPISRKEALGIESSRSSGTKSVPK
jgi:hypothetical protein